MRRKEFIDIILNSISDKFDIYHNYYFNGRKFVIYAYCYNHNNRFETSGDESKPLGYPLFWASVFYKQWQSWHAHIK